MCIKKEQSHLLLTRFPLVSSFESPRTPDTSSLPPRSKDMRVCKGRGKKEKKGRERDSPVQGAPASCRPGDGPDIASPLSSEKKRQIDKKGLLIRLLIKSLVVLHVTPMQIKNRLLYGSPLMLIIQRKSLEFPNNKEEHDAFPDQLAWDMCCMASLECACVFVMSVKS